MQTTHTFYSEEQFEEYAKMLDLLNIDYIIQFCGDGSWNITLERYYRIDTEKDLKALFILWNLAK